MYLFMPCNVYAEFAHVQYQIHMFFSSHTQAQALSTRLMQ